jgi:hypothetical protein
MSLASFRFRGSTVSMGSRNVQRTAASLSLQRYFSCMTRLRGQGFSVRMKRNAPREDQRTDKDDKGGERTVMVEQVFAVLPPHLDIERKVTEEFDDLRHLIIVLGEQLALPLRIEKEFCRKELEHL